MLVLALLLAHGVAIDDCACDCAAVVDDAADDAADNAADVDDEPVAATPPPGEKPAFQPAPQRKTPPLPKEDPRLVDPQTIITASTAGGAVCCVGCVGAGASLALFSVFPPLVLLAPVVAASGVAALGDVIVHQGDPGWRTFWTALAAGGSFVGVTLAIAVPGYLYATSSKNPDVIPFVGSVAIGAGVVAAGATTFGFIVTDPELNGQPTP